jgi:hypothetical protein
MEALGSSSEMLLFCNANEIAQMPKLHLIPSGYWIDRNKILDESIAIIANSPSDVKALVLNALGHGFDLEDVDEGGIFMSSRAEALGRSLAYGLALPLAAWAADPAGKLQPTQVSASPDRSAGLQAFAQIERVLLNPRCVNCHVPDGPLQGDAKRVHYPAVQRGVDGRGVAPLNCATCHSTQNSPLAHAPPGLDAGGQPGWRMPSAKMKMSWFGLSGSALCKVFRDPRTNGGRSLAMLRQHMATDHLVAWAWHPGPGRELPPLDKPAFDEQVLIWIRNGAPCDRSES